jgi:hypothetical protein
VEAAEAYFGIPDEVGVYLPPEGFARDLGMAELPSECLEVNFEQVSPRPLSQLLRSATFSATFIDQAVAAACESIQVAQGIALLYDFDYQVALSQERAIGALQFIGSFPFVGTTPAEEPKPRPDPRIEIRAIVDDVL